MNFWPNQLLLQKYPRYHRWHQHPRHPFWHWVVFSFVAILVFNHLSIRIGDYLNEEILSVSIQTPQAQAVGNTYYVATTGNDANPGTITQPFRTIAKGLLVTRAGDTLYIRGGSYSEAINSNSQFIPSGTSWANAPVISAYPGENVTMYWLNLAAPTSFQQSIQYLIFDGIKFNAIAGGYSTGGMSAIGLQSATHHVRVKNCEVYNAQNGALGVWMGRGSGGGGYNEIINCKVHDNKGVNPGEPIRSGTVAHGLYITMDNNLFDRLEVYNNGHLGIQLYCSDPGCRPTGNVIRNSVFFNNGLVYTASGANIVVSGDNNLVYNNLVYNNIGGILLCCNGGATNAKIYGNTIYNTGDSGAIQVQGGSGNLVSNNIIYGTPNQISEYYTPGVTYSNNLCGFAGKGCSIVGDPKFVNSLILDLHLQSTSPAINAGATLAEVTKDYDGVSRPQGSAYDIGAYEFWGTVTTPPPTSNCFTGNWTITNQQPSSCVPYVQNGIFAKQLPNAGNGGPLSNLAPNSDAIAQNTLTNGGTLSQQNWGNSVIATPGLSDWSGVPMYYGRISDPIYFVRSCGGNCNAQGTYWHIPNQAKASGTADAFFTVWDQTINKVLGVYSIYFRALPPCTATTQATACPIDYPSGTGAQVSDPINDRDYALSVSEGHEGNSLYNKGQSLVVRHKELMDGVINHALYLNILCFKDTSGFTSVFFPVPPDGTGLTGCSAVSSDSGDPNFRPTMGQLFFLDYTDIQINAMNLSAPQKTLLRSLVHYGAYVGDGTPEPSIYVSRFESGEAYVLNGGSPSPVYAWLEAQGIPCVTGSVTESACRYTIPVFSNVPAMTGPNCPTTGCGIEKHLHIADPCVAKGLAGMAGGCVSSAPVSTPTPTPAPTPTPSTSSSPIAWWKFDETSGTLALDSSGNNLTGTLINGPVWTTGKIGNALQFDGVNDAVTLGNPAVLNFGTGSFTYSLWVNVAQSVGFYDMPWFKGGSDLGRPGYDMELGTGGWSANINDGVSSRQVTFGSESLTQWVLLTAVVDRSSGQFLAYKNGVLVSSNSISGLGSLSGASSARISGLDVTQHLFRGLIDDVRIYNRVFSASEIQTLYSQASITTLSSCDLNQDSKTDILDFQLLANVILGLSPNTGGYDINKDGQVNILDTQVLANVILGKTTCP